MIEVEDVMGALVILLRTTDAIHELVSNRISAIVEAPPSIQLQVQGATRYPFGRGSDRIRTQRQYAIAKCYGTTDPTGVILARQIAGRVSARLHNYGPATVGSTYIRRIYAPDISEALVDPGTRRPYHTVRIEILASDQAVA